jgi:diacylglycerol kinase family enzyme
MRRRPGSAAAVPSRGGDPPDPPAVPSLGGRPPDLQDVLYRVRDPPEPPAGASWARAHRYPERVRALLIVNPHATSTTQLRRAVIVRALSSAVELEVVETRYRGHAIGLAAAALSEGFGLVLTLGGDGTVNEAVNGILGAHPAATGQVEAARLVSASGHARGAGHTGPDGRAGSDAHAGPDGHAGAAGHARAAGVTASLPALAPLPGGSANVFTRAVGLPQDPVDAAGQILQALADGRSRSVSVGLAGDRYFTFNAGLGLDGEVIRAVDGRRAGGKAATPALYIRTTLRQFYAVTDRRRPALMLERDGHPPDGPLFISFISNTAPWSYLGRQPINPSPQAGFDSGLDVFALRSLQTVTMARAAAQMLSESGRPPHGRSVLGLHDVGEVTIRSTRPVAFQLDGEYMGERECVRFLSVPDALRVIA